jgi:hypothetical protein
MGKRDHGINVSEGLGEVTNGNQGVK